MTYPHQTFVRQLQPLYGEHEARSLVYVLLADGFGLSKTEVLSRGEQALSPAQWQQAGHMVARIAQGEPVQYIVGKAWFAGRCFHVEPGVLIPRPETEELCQWVSADTHTPGAEVLDVGTGSGCIALTLAATLPQARVTGYDLSTEALRIAAQNAQMLHLPLTLEERDALQLAADEPRWDIIVSNPPYICEQEKADMEPNVLHYEPAMALFVPDDDPLRFYRAITRYAATALRPGGRLYFEMNPLYAEPLQALMEEQGFGCDSKTDQFGRLRLMRGSRP